MSVLASFLCLDVAQLVHCWLGPLSKFCCRYCPALSRHVSLCVMFIRNLSCPDICLFNRHVGTLAWKSVVCKSWQIGCCSATPRTHDGHTRPCAQSSSLSQSNFTSYKTYNCAGRYSGRSSVYDADAIGGHAPVPCMRTQDLGGGGLPCHPKHIQHTVTRMIALYMNLTSAWYVLTFCLSQISPELILINAANTTQPMQPKTRKVEARENGCA
jgi:hypothetical protein